jgi:hypothetical protein
MHGWTAGAKRPFYFRDCVVGTGKSAMGRNRLAEDKGFYVPDLLADADFEPRPALWDAAEAHAGSLRNAEHHIDDALNLARVLRAAIREDGDSRAMQADTVLRLVEKKLDRARRQIDRHDASHVNLFLAYAELRDDTDGR